MKPDFSAAKLETRCYSKVPDLKAELLSIDA
jgi:hypothetical protein